MIVKNAIIESATLTIERGFCLTSFINVDYGGSGQGFGGYVLYTDKNAVHDGNYAGHWIARCLRVADVEDWNSLKGKAIRVALDEEGFGGIIQGIGHITKDIWFYPKEDFKDEFRRTST